MWDESENESRMRKDRNRNCGTRDKNTLEGTGFAYFHRQGAG